MLEIEVQGARQVRAAMGDEAVLIFIAPPDPTALRERLAGRGTDSDEAIERRLETAKQELEAQQEFKHVVVNDELERAAAELEGIVRAELSWRGLTRHPVHCAPMIKPRVDTLLARPIRTTPRSWSPPSAPASSTATTARLARAATRSTRRRWSRRKSGNYLTIALEELAQGKIKYEYKA